MQIIPFADFSPIYKNKARHENFLTSNRLFWNRLNFFLNTVKLFITCVFRSKTKTKQSYRKNNNQLLEVSCSSLCVLFSATIFTLMIDRTWPRVCRSVMSWNSAICTYFAFTRVTMILPWAVSAAYTYCIALTKSSNSLSLFQNNPGLYTGCWHFWISTQDIRFVFTFPNYCTWTSPGDFQN